MWKALKVVSACIKPTKETQQSEPKTLVSNKNS